MMLPILACLRIQVAQISIESSYGLVTVKDNNRRLIRSNGSSIEITIHAKVSCTATAAFLELFKRKW